MKVERVDALRARHRQEALRRGVNPRDVDVLLSDLTGHTLAWMIAHGGWEIESRQLAALMERRYRGEPLQYIRGKADFYSRQYRVDDRALIPRPETELLVEAAIGRAPQGGRVLDIGTGSGCIAISIERERPDLCVIGVDLSMEALSLAAINRRDLQSKIRLAASDMLSSVRGSFDMVVSNPPYIAESDMASLQAEVRYEPRMALTPGRKGTEAVERILDDARSLLRPGGTLLMEIGFGQADALRAMVTARSYVLERFIDDLAGIARVIVLSV